jgi:hypothetical protein
MGFFLLLHFNLNPLCLSVPEERCFIGSCSKTQEMRRRDQRGRVWYMRISNGPSAVAGVPANPDVPAVDEVPTADCIPSAPGVPFFAVPAVVGVPAFACITAVADLPEWNSLHFSM